MVLGHISQVVRLCNCTGTAIWSLFHERRYMGSLYLPAYAQPFSRALHTAPIFPLCRNHPLDHHTAGFSSWYAMRTRSERGRRRLLSQRRQAGWAAGRRRPRGRGGSTLCRGSCRPPTPACCAYTALHSSLAKRSEEQRAHGSRRAVEDHVVTAYWRGATCLVRVRVGV